MLNRPLRAMMIGAHPDDCDISTYSITTRLVKAGCTVRFVSMTTGNAGHQTMRGEELVNTRAKQAPHTSASLMRFSPLTTAASRRPLRRAKR